MKEYLISLFLDDELTLDEKCEFVGFMSDDNSFRQEIKEMLEQEKLLKGDMVKHVPCQLPIMPFRLKVKAFITSSFPAIGGFVTATLLFMFVAHMQAPYPASENVTLLATPHRFVLYLPQAKEASVVGSFSDWSAIPMQKIGDSGYWALNLNLEPGEHRYNYLVENKNRIPDPTIQNREFDDFGGENTIISVGASI
jgi:hypothetical protein